MQFAFTPESSAALNNSFLIEMQEKRSTLLAAMPEKERLEYQLMRALKSEDYESATEIREKLKETQ
jgi:protein-arginine kinase activator protein McsA